MLPVLSATMLSSLPGPSTVEMLCWHMWSGSFWALSVRISAPEPLRIWGRESEAVPHPQSRTTEHSSSSPIFSAMRLLYSSTMPSLTV